MINRLSALFKKAAIGILLLLCINSLYSQIPGSSDHSIGLGFFNGPVKVLKLQPDGKILAAGSFTSYKTRPVKNFARLNQDWSLDTTFIVEAQRNSIGCMEVQPDGKILIGGEFTSINNTTTNYLARLNQDGSLDQFFKIGTGANNKVNVITLKGDGKILVGGDFTQFNGSPKYRIMQLNPDGSEDSSFSIGEGANGGVSAILIQQNGMILVGGAFTIFKNVLQYGFVRVDSIGNIDDSFVHAIQNLKVSVIVEQADGMILMGGDNGNLIRVSADGSLDNTFRASFIHSISSIVLDNLGRAIMVGRFYVSEEFSPHLIRLQTDGSLDSSFKVGRGPEEFITSMIIKPDGKFVIGGSFNTVAKYPANFIAQLNPDGSVDTSVVAMGANNMVQRIAVQNDGKILVGGDFTIINGVSKKFLARLNSDGSLDHSFSTGDGPNNYISGLVVQQDGKILVEGIFTMFNGVSHKNLVRLNPDGTIDQSFNIGSGPSGEISSVTLQADGKIIIGGNFKEFNGIAERGIVRLHKDGSVDNSFHVGSAFNGAVGSVGVFSNGKILVSGSFTAFNDPVRKNLVLLNSDGSLDWSFRADTLARSTPNFIAIQKDERILVSATFEGTNNVPPKYFLARLNKDGTLDPSFKASLFNDFTSMFVIQPDGKIVVGGYFYSEGGDTRNYITRLNVNGSVDKSFQVGTGFHDMVVTMALQPDGKIVVGGWFLYYQEVSNNYLIRLWGAPVKYNSIRGRVYVESNFDCFYQVSEKSISSMIIKAEPGPFYGGSNRFGEYVVRVDSGTATYSVSQEWNGIQGRTMVNQCAPVHHVSLKGANSGVCCFDFANKIKQCTQLNVSVQNIRMRRCMRSNTIVEFCNYGSISASGAQVKIVYPSYVIPISSVPMWSSKQDSILIYDLALIPQGACGRITITDSVDCGNEAIRGLTQCIKATISPASDCISENSSWDRSSIKVSGKCHSGNALFTIINAGSGNMGRTHSYRIFVNDTLIFSSTFQLRSGESFVVTYPAGGQAIRLEADQHPLHPGKSRPRETIEGCGLSSIAARKGLAITVPQDDLDEETAITCGQIIDSYDPNDKLSMPIGVGSAHRIDPGTELEYTIRFQNTGSDTAYNIKIVDTLDVALKPGSFIPGASSHSYSMEISGKGQAVLTFNFDNIYLPHKAVNELESNGLVSYRITVPSETPIGTTIKNRAHIFFDYNSAIITNETIHTVDPTVNTDLSKGADVLVGVVTSSFGRISNLLEVKLYPNPSGGLLFIEVPEPARQGHFIITSLTGVVERSFPLQNFNIQQVNLGGLHPGLHLYEVRQEGERMAGGVLQVR